MTAPACTTWSTRSSTTRSTKRSPVLRPHRRHHPLRQLGHRRGQRARHAGRHAPDREPARAGSHHDGAARRRKVRPRQLQGVGRSARRRRLGGQRAVRVGEAGNPQERQGLLPGISPRRSGDRVQADRRRRAGLGAASGTKVTFKPDPEVFKHHRVQLRHAGAAPARAVVPEQRPARSPSSTSARIKRARLQLRGRRGLVRRGSEQVQGRGPRQADPLHATPRKGSRSRSRFSGTTRTRRTSSASPTTSRTRTAARTSPASARR